MNVRCAPLVSSLRDVLKQVATSRGQPASPKLELCFERRPRGSPPPDATASTIAPNLLLSTSGTETRAVLLVGRPEGIIGVEVGGKMVQAPALATQSRKSPQWRRCRKSVALYAQLQRAGVPWLRASAAHAPFEQPLLLHTNHLLAWGIKPNATAGLLYAHSLQELSRLRARHLRTIQPTQCLVANSYFTWERWASLACEPGWSLHLAEEPIVRSLLSGTASIDELHHHCDEVGLRHL